MSLKASFLQNVTVIKMLGFDSFGKSQNSWFCPTSMKLKMNVKSRPQNKILLLHHLTVERQSH